MTHFFSTLVQTKLHLTCYVYTEERDEKGGGPSNWCKVRGQTLYSEEQRPVSNIAVKGDCRVPTLSLLCAVLD